MQQNSVPTTTNRIFSWGFIGLGNITNQFVRDLLLVPEARPLAAASRDLAKAVSFAKQYGIERAYGSYQALLDDPDVEIVYIGTPHTSHAELSIAAMRKGKHVLCEKPLAVNEEQVWSMVQVAKSEKRFMMEALWSRFNPSIRRCLELVAEGAIGEVNYVAADFTFFRRDPDDSRMLNASLAGGSLLDMGVYPIFLAYALFGYPENIFATGLLHRTGVDLQMAATMQFGSGIAQIYSGFVSQSDMTARIYGTDGRIYIHPYWHEAQGYTMIQGNDGQYRTSEIIKPTRGKGFTGEIEACHLGLRQNLIEHPDWTHINSIELIRIADEIRAQMGVRYPFETGHGK